ncbi:MAG: Mrp/NBP35 family ATP-binding protein [Candidatus Dormibacteria bacterium]
MNQNPAPGSPGASPEALPGIRHTVAIGSGKGGVGKSTVAANLAVALALDGASVGLLDADIYGATIPAMMGNRTEAQSQGRRIQPNLAHQIRIMSMALLLEPGRDTLVWRGPMVAKAVSQLILDVDWGELDYLLIDLPPGTGDAPLTLAQQVPLTGGVVVCTPQEVAVNTALKAVSMFNQLRVPVLGLIENMSYFVCPSCGTRTDIFSHGGAQAACEELNLPFLGMVPLDPVVRESGDSGNPVVLQTEAPQAAAFREAARRLALEVERQGAPPPPLIEVR